MTKIIKIIALSLLPIYHAYAVAVMSGAAVGGAVAAAAAANAAERNSQLNQVRLGEQNANKNGNISGVFVCSAKDPESRGYYARDYTKCYFWNSDKGNYSVSVSQIPDEFLPGKEIVNIFLNTHDKKFEFYYR